MFPLFFVWVCKACHKTGHKMMDCPNNFTEDECETQDHNTEDSNTDVQTDTVQNTTTVEIHNTTQEGERTTDDIEQLQSVQKVTFSKTDSTKNSKASGKKNTLKHGQKTISCVSHSSSVKLFGQSIILCPVL
jgi:hypothetical protein